MARNTTADARIALRLPQMMKSRFETAAEVAGHSSLSDFVLTTLQTKSAEILERESKLVLSSEAYRELLLILENTEKSSASEKLTKLFKKYEKNINQKIEPW